MAKLVRRPVVGSLARSLVALLVLVGGVLLGRAPTAAVADPALTHAATTPTVVYVVPGGAGTQDGSSWANGKDLAPALSGATSNTQLWVKQGTYKPTTTGDRTATFQLKNGVALYGGFAGTETALSQRNATGNMTILSGDLLGNDGANFANNTENSYHVVTGSGADATASLDRFTISGGNANGSSALANIGGGLFNDAGSPTLTNLTFSGNSADAGGGMFDDSSSSTLTNLTFSGNRAIYDGGGMYNGKSSPTLTNVTFSGNSATTGGGMYNNSNSSPTLTNVTFGGNSATNGGGMYNTASTPKIRNSIIWGNSDGIVTNPSSALDVQYSDVQGTGTYAGTGNRNEDPKFVSPVAAASAPTTTGDYHLQASSPEIDRGDNSAIPPGVTTDRDGKARVINGIVDLGSYEVQACLPGSNVVLYVNSAASGANNGEKWLDAYPDLQAALSRASTCTNGVQIWVAKGTYKPTTTTDRTATFQLKNGVALYGGFAGTETALSQRNATGNVTILSGDLLGNDGANFANNTDNSYHVVTGNGTDATASLDRFTITGGNANGGGQFNGSGGGLHNDSSSPTLTNLTFSGNSATDGGGMFNFFSSPTLTNVTFSGNSGSGHGGGMHNDSSSPTLTNVTFTGNSATHGGGMDNKVSSPTLTNVTFSGNSASQNAGGMFNKDSTPKIRNSIIWGNSKGIVNNGTGVAVVQYSDVQGTGTYVGTGNRNVDPQFVSPIAATTAPTTTGDYHLKGTSPVIDQGNNSLLPPGVTSDRDGKPRIVGGIVDMGAYEVQVRITTTALPDGKYRNPYQFTLTAIYTPTLPLTWTLSPMSAFLPPGITLSTTGVLTGTPTATGTFLGIMITAANANGSDTRTYTLTITNNAPVAVAESYTTTQDRPLVVGGTGVLENDTDADGNPLTAQTVSSPTHGMLTLHLDGSFVYTPTLGYAGPDSFAYQASDGAALSNVVTDTLTIDAQSTNTPTTTATSTAIGTPTGVATGTPTSTPTAQPYRVSLGFITRN